MSEADPTNLENFLSDDQREIAQHQADKLSMDMKTYLKGALSRGVSADSFILEPDTELMLFKPGSTFVLGIDEKTNQFEEAELIQGFTPIRSVTEPEAEKPANIHSMIGRTRKNAK